MGRPNSIAARADYVERVNRAIDHIVRHLDEPLPLETVARVACFSPFHFHRVFRALVGETLAQFVKRVRLERALMLLSHPPMPSLTEVALRCGFASSSDFSRSFKQRYGVPPSEFDVGALRAQRRDELIAAMGGDDARHLLARLPPGDNPDGFSATVRGLPPRRVAYVRVADPYRRGVVVAAARQLVSWAERRGLADGQWLGYMWDDPDIVAREDCRYDVGVVVDGSVTSDGDVGVLELPTMCVAELEVRGGIDLEVRALDWLFGTWLPASGYQPSAHPCTEAWIGRPFAHGEQHFELHVQLPVEDLVS